MIKGGKRKVLLLVVLNCFHIKVVWHESRRNLKKVSIGANTSWKEDPTDFSYISVQS
uniref:Uncharacterized protein n=1 Tax=Arundo donax TaxID=35708 RepID=A0A0A9AYD7_ARUDO